MKWKGLQSLKKEQLAAVFILGVLLMVIALPSKTRMQKKEEPEQNQSDTAVSDLIQSGAYEKQLECRLEESLSQMEGVGRVKAVVTTTASSERVLAKDKTSAKSVEGVGADSDSARTDAASAEGGQTDSEHSETTVYEERETGSVPYVVKEVLPSVKGVLIVAEGGGDPVIRQNICDAVMALFSVESHKIMVVRMKEG